MDWVPNWAEVMCVKCGTTPAVFVASTQTLNFTNFKKAPPPFPIPLLPVHIQSHQGKLSSVTIKCVHVFGNGVGINM